MNRIGGAVAVGALVVGLAGCGGSGEAASSSSSASSAPVNKLKVAVERCATFPREVLSSDGISASLDTEGTDDFNGDAIEDVDCILSSLNAPDHVRTHIDTTRALDGQQTDEWDVYEARWTYHPDSGLQITIIDRS